MAMNDDELKNNGLDNPPAEETADTAEAVEEPVPEAAAEDVQEAETAEETAAEKVMEAVEDAVETVEDAMEVTADIVTPEEPEIMKKKGAKTAVIVIAVIVVVLAALAGVTYRFGGGLIMPDNPDLDKFFYNKYNNMGYVDKTGETIKTIVDQNNEYAEDDDDKITVAQFKEEYNLPKDMRADTNITAAEYSIPISTFAEMNNVSFDELKKFYELGDEVNDQMTWGEVQGEVTIKVAIGGEENLDAFKEEYGFGEEVTLDTKWKEVRDTIDKAEKEAYAKQKEQYEQMMAELEAQQNSEDGDDAQAPADGADAQTPADGADAAPAEGADAVPADGADAAPAEGADAAPAEE